MPKCLMLTPYPLRLPRHGGQVRADGLRRAAIGAGWHVDSIGIYSAGLFMPEERSRLDLVLHDPALQKRALADMAFADYHIAIAAAANARLVERLARSVDRLAPDVILLEQPWAWLPLHEAVPDLRVPLVYSSQNIEWRARAPLFRLGLGLRTPTSDAMTEATRLLEREVSLTADLVISISDSEAREIAAVTGRRVAYMPASSNLVEAEPAPGRFTAEAIEEGCRYAALMGSAYWPNVEGFFDIFPEGLGFLAQEERLWVAGTLGEALRKDGRYQTFGVLNDTRLREVGFVAEEEKAEFFAAAACVVAPVNIGAGAKLKTADAIASGRPVIATSHALDGYGPMVARAEGAGIYRADDPASFRALVRRALRESLPGCAPEVRAMLSAGALATAWQEEVGALLRPAPA